MSSTLRRISLAVVAIASSFVASADAVTVPVGFSATTVANGLFFPTAFDFAPDGRIFVCQQNGAVRIVDAGGTLLPTPFLSIAVDFDGNERGLLGIALDPSFATNGYVYVYYSTVAPAMGNRISRFTASGNTAVPGSEAVLLDLDPSDGPNHNGGDLRFGPDGKLYCSTGDRLDGANAQTLTNPLGKILRLNSDGSIPTDNPFFNDPTPGVRKEIWAYGFRNPWRFVFQPGTGEPFIADVGEMSWEEVDIGVAGHNYGWPFMEGNHCYPADEPCDTSGLTLPIFEQSHQLGASIIGGDFIQGTVFPEDYRGSYVYGDYIFDSLRRLVLDANNTVVVDRPFVSGIPGPVHIRFHADAVWYASMNDGAIVKITYAPGAVGGDTVGVYVPATGAWFLRNQNSPGPADSVFTYGPGGSSLIALRGDWDGDGVDSPGLYDPATSTFFLKNSNAPGPADVAFGFGPAGSGWRPIVGDWTGNHFDSVGLYDSTTGTFFLRDVLAPGPADDVFGFGPGGPGWVPLAGDWDGDGIDTVGLYSSASSVFYLRNEHASGPADVVFGFGPPAAGWVPVTGDFDRDGADTVGLYRPSDGVFFLRNYPLPGPADFVFGYGPAGARPLVGNWDGP